MSSMYLARGNAFRSCKLWAKSLAAASSASTAHSSESFLANDVTSLLVNNLAMLSSTLGEVRLVVTSAWRTWTNELYLSSSVKAIAFEHVSPNLLFPPWSWRTRLACG